MSCITALYNRHGQLQGFSKVTRDMTERRSFEEAVRELNEQLTAARGAACGHQSHAGSKRADENETFVYSVSHDVRGPLVNLQGFSQELQRSCGDLIERDRERADDSGRGARPRAANRHRRHGGIDALHADRGGASEQYCRRAAAAFPTRPCRLPEQQVDVAPMVRRVLGSLRRARSDEQDAEIMHRRFPAGLRPTRGAIEQVFTNLIGNALRYRDPARPCRIEIGGATCRTRAARSSTM